MDSNFITINGVSPKYGKDCFFASGSILAGDIVLGDQCSVWFHAVLRGDVNTIRIGNKVNIQDGTIVHCTYKRASTTIGNNVSIGHKAIIHGCHIESDVLIGMGSIIMDHAYIPSNTLIGAGSLILENTRLESGYVYAGSPIKKIKELSTELFENEISRIANNYVLYSSWFKNS